MRKITIILLAAFIALSLATYFQTTRAMLIQALQGAASIQYARIHLVKTSIAIPYTSRIFFIAWPTLVFNMPQIVTQRTHNFYDEAKNSDQQTPHKQKKPRSLPLAILTAPLAIMLGADSATGSEEQSKKADSGKKDKTTQEAEEIAKKICSSLGLSPNNAIWPTLRNASFEEQDKFLSQLMEFLMNPNDTSSYKAIAHAAKECSKLWEKHPDLYTLIAAHAEKPKAQQFLDQFNALENAQLPPYFAQVREKINETCNKLSLWQKGKIWWKF